MTSIKFKTTDWSKGLTRKELVEEMMDYIFLSFWTKVKIFFGSEKFVRDYYNKIEQSLRK